MRYTAAVCLGGLVLGLASTGCCVCLPQGWQAPPLSVAQRDSLWGKGKVLIITNTSDKHLHELRIKVVGAGGKDVVQVMVAPTLKPHDTIEVGWLELAEKIEPGDTVTISCLGYGRMRVTVPR